MSDLLRRYAEARWADDGEELDRPAAGIAEPGPHRTRLRIINAHPERWKKPLTWRNSDCWPTTDDGKVR